MARAQALADQIKGQAPLTMTVTKTLLRRMRQRERPVEDNDLIAKVYTSADFREGLTAFLAKRPAQWTGK